MTRIVLDPEELVRVAGYASETANAYEREAIELAHPVLPAMPSYVAANVSDGLGRAAGGLRALAPRLDAEALELRLRAAIASGDIAGMGLALLLRAFDLLGSSLFPHLPEAYSDAAAEMRALLDSGAEPSELHAFFETLNDDQRGFLVRAYPGIIGPLNGAPFEMRYDANRLLIESEIDDLEDARAVLVDHIEGTSGVARESLEASLAELDGRLADLRAWASPKRNFLLFDPSGDGRIAEVHGDLDAAEHVAVLVPGISNDLSDFESNFGPDAAALYRKAEFLSGDGVATIAWLGYDTPDNFTTAGSNSAARDGARDLAPFVTGLEAGGDKNVSVVGHSYGSLVTGVALTDADLKVDDVVFLGSPGVGVNDRDDLGSGFDVWAAKTPADPIPFSPVHGEDPSSEGFGAKRFDTDAEGSVLKRHSTYYDEGSVSLQNIALIVTGQDDKVTML